jgi:hypothetical protein
MTIIVALLMAFTSPSAPRHIEAFRATATMYLTYQQAEEHLLAARAAGLVHGVRPELLLAIALHESRYQPATRTKEPGNRESCGVMTPIPKRRCTPEDLTILGGYDAGAAHLRTWMNLYHDAEAVALLAYAGGAGLVRVCLRDGRWLNPRGFNICDIAYEFRRQARIIGRALRAGQEK